jgi:predicted dehydrogenase
LQEAQLQLGKKPDVEKWGTEDKEHQGIIHYTKDEKLVREQIKSLQGNYYHFYDGIYQSIVNDTREPVTATDGLNVMKIIEAAFKSSKIGKVVDLG